MALAQVSEILEMRIIRIADFRRNYKAGSRKDS
jgi:hypothetical protein